MTRSVYALFFVAFFMGAAAAQEYDCTDWQGKDQTTMNICSYEEFLKVDKSLNDAWGIVKPIIKNFSDELEELEDKPENLWQSHLGAQRAWVKFRDLHCLTERNLYFRGTIAPTINNTCRTNITKERIKELFRIVERLR